MKETFERETSLAGDTLEGDHQVLTSYWNAFMFGETFYDNLVDNQRRHNAATT